MSQAESTVLEKIELSVIRVRSQEELAQSWEGETPFEIINAMSIALGEIKAIEDPNKNANICGFNIARRAVQIHRAPYMVYERAWKRLSNDEKALLGIRSAGEHVFEGPTVEILTTRSREIADYINGLPYEQRVETLKLLSERFDLDPVRIAAKLLT